MAQSLLSLLVLLARPADDSDVIDELTALHDDTQFLYVNSARSRGSELKVSDHPDPLGTSDQAQGFAELYLALQLASRCDYFVVDTDSHISKLLIYFACARKGACPLVYDWSSRGGLLCDPPSSEPCADL